MKVTFSIIVVLTLLGSAEALARPEAGAINGSFEMGIANPSGVTHDGASYWVSDLPMGAAGELLVLDWGGVVVQRMTMGSSRQLRHLTFDGLYTWAVRDFSTVERLNSVGVAVGSFATTDSVGIAYDPMTSTIWDLERSNGGVPSNAIYKRDLNGTIIQTINTPSTHTSWVGLAWEGCTLWTADQASSELLRIDPGTGDVIAQYDAPADRPEDLAFESPLNILVADSLVDRLYRIEAGTIDVGGDAVHSRPHIWNASASG